MKLYYGFDKLTNVCQVLTWAYDDSLKEENQYYVELDQSIPYNDYAKFVGMKKLDDGTWVEDINKPKPTPMPPTKEQLQMQKLSDIEIMQLEESLKAESERQALAQKQYDVELLLVELTLGGTL